MCWSASMSGPACWNRACTRPWPAPSSACACRCARRSGDGRHSLAKRCIHALHPWVAFAIMPAFAFANAGVSLTGLIVGDDRRAGHARRGAGPVHRQAGRRDGGRGAGACYRPRAACRRAPAGAETYGVAILTGIGFTMSLFIGSLAFPGAEHIVEMRLGVIGGSILSALVGLAGAGGWRRGARRPRLSDAQSTPAPPCGRPRSAPRRRSCGRPRVSTTALCRPMISAPAGVTSSSGAPEEPKVASQSCSSSRPPSSLGRPAGSRCRGSGSRRSRRYSRRWSARRLPAACFISSNERLAERDRLDRSGCAPARSPPSRCRCSDSSLARSGTQSGETVKSCGPGMLAIVAAVIAGDEMHLHRDGPALVLEIVEAMRRRQHQVGRDQRAGAMAADLAVDPAQRRPWPDLGLDRRAVVGAFDADLPALGFIGMDDRPPAASGTSASQRERRPPGPGRSSGPGGARGCRRIIRSWHGAAAAAPVGAGQQDAVETFPAEGRRQAEAPIDAMATGRHRRRHPLDVLELGGRKAGLWSSGVRRARNRSPHISPLAGCGRIAGRISAAKSRVVLSPVGMLSVIPRAVPTG